MKIKKSGIILASTAAALLASGFSMTASAAEEAKVKCHGINGCKGQTACKTEASKGSKGNACKGHNECKSKGWEFTDTAEECTKKGGTVMKEEAAKKDEAPKE